MCAGLFNTDNTDSRLEVNTYGGGVSRLLIYSDKGERGFSLNRTRFDQHFVNKLMFSSFSYITHALSILNFPIS